MKAITIKQPWASLICSGVKDIENRTWPTKHRGRVMIHASAKPDREPYLIFNAPQMDYLDAEGREMELFEMFDFYKDNSLIIGSAEIVDCVVNHQSIWAQNETSNWVYDKEGNVIKENTTWNWVLANPILFKEPLPAKGKLSFWESECEILVCPQCGGNCLHDNHDIGMPNWGNPVHECEHCGNMIFESEFEKLK